MSAAAQIQVTECSSPRKFLLEPRLLATTTDGSGSAEDDHAKDEFPTTEFECFNLFTPQLESHLPALPVNESITECLQHLSLSPGMGLNATVPEPASSDPQDGFSFETAKILHSLPKIEGILFKKGGSGLQRVVKREVLLSNGCITYSAVGSDTRRGKLVLLPSTSVITPTECFKGVKNPILVLNSLAVAETATLAEAYDSSLPPKMLLGASTNAEQSAWGKALLTTVRLLKQACEHETNVHRMSENHSTDGYPLHINESEEGTTRRKSQSTWRSAVMHSNTELRNTRLELSASMSHASHLHLERLQLEKLLASSRNHCESLLKDKQNHRVKLQEFSAKYNDLQMRFDADQDYNNRLLREISQLEERCIELNTNLFERTKKYEILLGEQARLTRSYDGLTTNHSTIIIENDALKRRVKDLETELEHLQLCPVNDRVTGEVAASEAALVQAGTARQAKHNTREGIHPVNERSLNEDSPRKPRLRKRFSLFTEAVDASQVSDERRYLQVERNQLASKNVFLERELETQKEMTAHCKEQITSLTCELSFMRQIPFDCLYTSPETSIGVFQPKPTICRHCRRAYWDTAAI